MKATKLYSVKDNGVERTKYRAEDGSMFWDPPMPENSVHDERLREMLKSRRAPRCMTDDVFVSGMGTLDDQFKGDPSGLQLVIDGAKRQGYTPSPRDIYCPGLAMSCGDPDAFVKTRGDVARVCRKKGMDSYGAVNVKAYREPEEEPTMPRRGLAPDIAMRAAGCRAMKTPEILEGRTLADVANEISANHEVKLVE